jgi:hypothetical protein
MRHRTRALRCVWSRRAGSEEDGNQLPPEWAFGFRQQSGPEDHDQYGSYVMHMEIRADGTMTHTVDYCDGPDQIYDGLWGLQPDGAVRCDSVVARNRR